MKFGDKVLSPDGEIRDSFKGKGALCADFSELVFNYFGSYNIPHHMIERRGKNQLLVQRLEMLPFTLHVRNIAAGDLCQRFDVEEGQVLDCPIIEMHFKKQNAPLTLVNRSHCLAIGLASEDDLRSLSILASKANAILRSFFERRDLLLVDFYMEIGRGGAGLLIADEISPDTCRVWDRRTKRRLGKDSLKDKRQSAGEAYKDLLERIK